MNIFGIPEISFQLRKRYIKKIISLNVKENKIKRILDAGSGIGVYTFWLATKLGKAKVTGGDIDKKKMLVSQKMVNELHINNVKFVEMNIEKVAQRKRYNLIVSIDVLEHLSNYKEALDRFKGFLDKGNYLYIHVPQPNQRRIFNFFKDWHHKDHAREGILKADLEGYLKSVGFRIKESRETYGFFGKLAWELNHMTLKKNFVIAGITYPFLYLFCFVDFAMENKNGLGVAVLAQKK